MAAPRPRGRRGAKSAKARAAALAALMAPSASAAADDTVTVEVVVTTFLEFGACANLCAPAVPTLAAAVGPPDVTLTVPANNPAVAVSTKAASCPVCPGTVFSYPPTDVPYYTLTSSGNYASPTVSTVEPTCATCHGTVIICEPTKAAGGRFGLAPDGPVVTPAPARPGEQVTVVVGPPGFHTGVATLTLPNAQPGDPTVTLVPAGPDRSPICVVGSPDRLVDPTVTILGAGPDAPLATYPPTVPGAPPLVVKGYPNAVKKLEDAVDANGDGDPRLVVNPKGPVRGYAAIPKGTALVKAYPTRVLNKGSLGKVPVVVVETSKVPVPLPVPVGTGRLNAGNTLRPAGGYSVPGANNGKIVPVVKDGAYPLKPTLVPVGKVVVNPYPVQGTDYRKPVSTFKSVVYAPKPTIVPVDKVVIEPYPVQGTDYRKPTSTFRGVVYAPKPTLVPVDKVPVIRPNPDPGANNGKLVTVIKDGLYRPKPTITVGIKDPVTTYLPPSAPNKGDSYPVTDTSECRGDLGPLGCVVRDGADEVVGKVGGSFRNVLKPTSPVYTVRPQIPEQPVYEAPVSRPVYEAPPKNAYPANKPVEIDTIGDSRPEPVVKRAEAGSESSRDFPGFSHPPSLAIEEATHVTSAATDGCDGCIVTGAIDSVDSSASDANSALEVLDKRAADGNDDFYPGHRHSPLTLIEGESHTASAETDGCDGCIVTGAIDSVDSSASDANSALGVLDKRDEDGNDDFYPGHRHSPLTLIESENHATSAETDGCDGCIVTGAIDSVGSSASDANSALGSLDKRSDAEAEDFLPGSPLTAIASESHETSSATDGCNGCIINGDIDSVDSPVSGVDSALGSLDKRAEAGAEDFHHGSPFTAIASESHETSSETDGCDGCIVTGSIDSVGGTASDVNSALGSLAGRAPAEAHHIPGSPLTIVESEDHATSAETDGCDGCIVTGAIDSVDSGSGDVNSALGDAFKRAEAASQ